MGSIVKEVQTFQSFFEPIPKSFIQNNKHKISYEKLYSSVNNLRRAFKSYGITKQERMIIISDPCIEWILCDITCIKSGIITIPLFQNSSENTLNFQLNDCNATHLIVENEITLEKISKIIETTDIQFKNIFLFHKSKKFPEIKTIWQIIEERQNSDSDEILPNEVMSQEETATIIYTSGTSGNPRGVILSHKNLAYQLSDIHIAFINAKTGDNAISILPLAHIYQRTIIHFFLSNGINVFFVNDIPNVLKYIKQIQPELITIVPRILEKIYGTIKNQIQAKSKIVQKILLPMLEYASRKEINNSLLKLIFNTIFFNKVRNIFGKNMLCIVCGGAKLNAHEELFFHNAGVPFFQGYGMTECSPVIASNTVMANKMFTVGRPFSSVEVKISQIGEICVRGGSVFNGYLNKPQRDPDEFFPTGDLGTIDSDGFLTVVGRIKEQCKNSNGKFVNIIKIESMLNEISGIENSCVIAEGRPYTTAILFTQRIDIDSIQLAIDEMNKSLEHQEHIQYFYVSLIKPTVENNIITPSMKLRRNYVMERYAKEIEKLYNK